MHPSVALDCTPLVGQTGGVGTFVRGALEGLSACRSHRLAGYALSWRVGGGIGKLLPDGVRPIPRRLPAGALLRAWQYSRWPWAELWTGPVDVVHGTNFVVPPTRQAAAVVTVHDLTAVRYPELCTPTTRNYPVLVRRAAQRGAFVHVPSSYVAAEVTALLDIPPEQVRVVPHGVDHIRPPSHGDRKASLVLALGTVEPRKDYPALVHAFDRVAADHPDAHLVIAGEDGWGAAELAAAIDASPYRSRIARQRAVDDEARTRLLATARVLVYPSVYEGFGLPPLEAMAAGTPVVATAAGAVPETVGDAASLVPVGDIDRLAAAIGEVLESEEVFSVLQTRGRDRAAVYTWRRCASGLAALYADALDARR